MGADGWRIMVGAVCKSDNVFPDILVPDDLVHEARFGAVQKPSGFLVPPCEVVHPTNDRITWLAGVYFFCGEVYEGERKMSRGFIRNLPVPQVHPDYTVWSRMIAT